MYDKLPNYLIEYKYLPNLDNEIGNLYTTNQITNAIKKLQKAAGLNVTGTQNLETINLINTPRCGVSDILNDDSQSKQVANYVNLKWSHRNITWYFVKDKKDYYFVTEVRRYLREAFKIWSMDSGLKFIEINDRSNADIVISFEVGDHGDNNPFHKGTDQLGHAFYPGTGRGGDIHFNGDLDWYFNIYDTSSHNVHFFTVALHEIGHSIGLIHTDNTEDVMYPLYSILQKLSENDIKNVRQLYMFPELIETTSTTTTEKSMIYQDNTDILDNTNNNINIYGNVYIFNKYPHDLEKILTKLSNNITYLNIYDNDNLLKVDVNVSVLYLPHKIMIILLIIWCQIF